MPSASIPACSLSPGDFFDAFDLDRPDVLPPAMDIPDGMAMPNCLLDPFDYEN
jgi:hypothetical protein